MPKKTHQQDGPTPSTHKNAVFRPLTVLALLALSWRPSQIVLSTANRSATINQPRLIGRASLMDDGHDRNQPICKKGVTNETSVKSVCQCVPHWADTSATSQSVVTSLWNHHYVQKQIREAAMKSLVDCWHWLPDLKFDGFDKANFTNLTERMLSMLTPYRLKKSLKTRASPLVTERVLEVILRRLADPIQNPPLKIAVFGGSVTEGFRARANLIGLPENMRDSEVCPWSCRLERLLNHLLVGLVADSSNNETKTQTELEQVVIVKNFAVGGTDSMIGSTLLEFNLFGEAMGEYDIVIAAFAANDGQAPQGFVRDLMFEHAQKFMRLAKAQRPCSDLPLVIQLEDVMFDTLENQARTGLRYSREMAEAANWAGFMSVSYPDAVRDAVYADPSDATLTEFAQLHPGLTMHTGVAWVLAYNLLEGMLDACDAHSLPEHGNAEPRAGFPLPLLRDNLLSKEVSAMWKKQSEEQLQQCTHNKEATSCAYQFIAAKSGASTKEKVRDAITKVATNIEGWEAIGNPIRKPRRTWIATGHNSTFTIQLSNLDMPINRMLVLVRLLALFLCISCV